jgi:hypothetical protein
LFFERWKGVGVRKGEWDCRSAWLGVRFERQAKKRNKAAGEEVQIEGLFWDEKRLMMAIG